MMLLSSITVTMGQSLISNSWIDFNQKYVKINISDSGIYSIPFANLPNGFIQNNRFLQLFRNGIEVPLKISNDSIYFYGYNSNGASDSLLYRPMSARINKYSSLYSENEPYFLTNGKTEGRRIRTELNQTNAQLDQFHIAKTLLLFKNEYSLSTEAHQAPDYLNSFFEKGASKTGSRLEGVKYHNFTLDISSFADQANVKIKGKILLQGRSTNTRRVSIYAGRNDTERNLIGNLDLNGFEGKLFDFSISKDAISEKGQVVITLKSSNEDNIERFSVAFIEISYPQSINSVVEKNASVILSFEPNATKRSGFVLNKFANKWVFDITDVDNPYQYISDSKGYIGFENIHGKKTLVTSTFKSIGTDKIETISFNKIDPKDFNYIILTNNVLQPFSLKYAQYRSSTEGGGYKPIVVNMVDIYNQYNFGQISPLAIKRFIEFMVSDKNTDKYLFLIGPSVNPIEKMVPELNGYVPSIGYPASDILLVEGLGGIPQDVPVIPVGRLMVNNVNDADIYFEKVKEYEGNISNSFIWRKRVLHLNGGKNASEISQFKAVLSNLASSVETGVVGGNVYAFSKKSGIEVEPVDISKEVNNGIGLLTYFGHGSRVKTDLDFGYVTDPDRGFINNNKYSLMYFNGCGVGNIFRGLYNSSLNSPDKRPLTLDWLLAPKRGAIAIISNSYYSYLTPTTKYLELLYSNLFSNHTDNFTIGEIHKKVAIGVMKSNPNSYDIGNIQQSLLQGDPALVLIQAKKPDFTISKEDGIILRSMDSSTNMSKTDSITINFIVNNEGRFVVNSQLEFDVVFTQLDNSQLKRRFQIASVAFSDTINVKMENIGLISRVHIVLDPNNEIVELNELNNQLSLDLDWNEVKKYTVYPSEQFLDRISPTLLLNVNGKTPINELKLQDTFELTFKIMDNSVVKLDTINIELFLKNCWDESCDFYSVPFNNKDIKLKRLNSNSIEISKIFQGIKSGRYELLIKLKDENGNVNKNPYFLVFEVADEGSLEDILLITSPNPTSNYVKFELENSELIDIDMVNYEIVNSLGVVIKRHNTTNFTTWYWECTDMPAGLYVAHIRINKGSKEIIQSRKIVISR